VSLKDKIRNIKKGSGKDTDIRMMKKGAGKDTDIRMMKKKIK